MRQGCKKKVRNHMVGWHFQCFGLIKLGDLAYKLCGSRKYPYPPPPPTEDHWKFRGEGGFKGSNFQGVRGVHGKCFPKGDGCTYKTLKATYDRSEEQKHTYVRCFETKVGTPGR